LNARLALASALAASGGACLLASGVKGSLGLLGPLLSLLAELLPPPLDRVVSYVMLALSFLASLGGMTVLAGAFFLAFGRLTTGKLLVRLGSGTGIIGLLSLLISKALGGLEALLAFLMTAMSSVGWLGMFLSVSSLLAAGKPKKEEVKPKPRPEGPVKRLVRP